MVSSNREPERKCALASQLAAISRTVPERTCVRKERKRRDRRQMAARVEFTPGSQAERRSAGRANSLKNSAWLTTALTVSARKGFAIRKAGSGLWPVSKVSG